MKKWTKAALLTGCACCIAGAALILCGWADGGKAYVETYDLNAFDGSATKEESISASFRPVTIPVISPGGFRRKKERMQWNIACGTVF